MRLLVIATEPISTDQLRRAVPEASDAAEVEVMLIAPALHDSPLKFWLSDADAAIARADRVRREPVAQLGAGGLDARGDTGESDPVAAIEDSLRTFAADLIVLFVHPAGRRRYRGDVDPDEVERRFRVPVERVLASERPANSPDPASAGRRPAMSDPSPMPDTAPPEPPPASAQAVPRHGLC